MKKLFLILLISIVFTQIALAKNFSVFEDFKIVDKYNNLITKDANIFSYTGIKHQRMTDGFITLEYKNGILDNKILIEYDDGSRIVIGIDSGLAEGKIIEYYPNGNIALECEYHQGKCITDERSYYEDGTLKSVNKCINGEFNKTLTSYYKNGKIDTEFEIKDNIPNGQAKKYDEDGNLLSEIQYVNGKKHGLGKVYYPNGNLFYAFTFANDIEDGKIIKYYENGNVHQISNVKQGNIEGDNYTYYESGRIFIKAKLENDKILNMEFYYDEADPYLIYLGTACGAFILSFIITYLFMAYFFHQKPNNFY